MQRVTCRNRSQVINACLLYHMPIDEMISAHMAKGQRSKGTVVQSYRVFSKTDTMSAVPCQLTIFHMQ